MKKQSRSFEIALSAIACAVAALALTMGSYVRFLLAAGYLIAVFALMVPLAKEQILGFCLAYAGAALLAFFFAGLAIVQILPFIVFFGLHPLANYFQKKYVHKTLLHGLLFLVKAVWFDLSLWLGWVVLEEFLGLTAMTWYDLIAQNLYLILFLGGTAVFAVYDYMIFLCQRAMNAVIRRIGR